MTQAKSLVSLPNIGNTLLQRLKEIGIDSIEKLVKTGSIQAFSQMDVKKKHNSIHYLTLYRLEAAIKGINWHDLTEEQRSSLRKEFRHLNF